MNKNELDYVKIGQRVRAARKNKNLQQAELAYLAGLTTSHMSHIETGQTKPSLPTVVKLANVLDISVDELLCDNMRQTKVVYDKKIADLLADCDRTELQAFYEILMSAKNVLRKHREQ